MKDDPKILEHVLHRVVAETRAEAAPELDWKRVEARLGQAPSMPLVKPAPSHGLRAGFVVLAAGVSLALGWALAGQRAPVASPIVPDAPRLALNGDAFVTGTRIEASAEDVAVEHARHSQWTLERGSRATVTSRDGFVRVELEKGSLVAHVVPSLRPETFVVEAAGTRVAVHGTAFRVALSSEHVDVSVTEGIVLVGPREQPGSGRSISAHESSSFTLGGVPMGDSRTASGETRHRASERRGTANVGRPREPVNQPSIDEVENVVTQVLNLGATCFQSRTATANGVRVTASTTITLRALPAGGIELVALEPPLAPPVQNCIGEGIQKLSITKSQQGISIVRRMELER